jgi:hypothetical protein
MTVFPLSSYEVKGILHSRQIEETIITVHPVNAIMNWQKRKYTEMHASNMINLHL